MTLREFRDRVWQAFGPDMRHATPANVREFLDQIAREEWVEDTHRVSGSQDAAMLRLELPADTGLSYEQVLRRFFVDTLEHPGDQSLVALWMFALELGYAGLHDQNAEQLDRLFGVDADR